MQISDMTKAHIQEIQRAASETQTKVTLTEREVVGDVEKMTTIFIEPMKLEFTSNA